MANFLTAVLEDAKAKEVGDISRGLIDVANAIEGVEKLVAALGGRLGPVLAPSPPNPPGQAIGTVSASTSPLADNLRTAKFKLSCIAADLQDLHNRLGLD